ncbi:MAG: FAD binding domain-containing protein, partial [Rhodoferax sp.]
TKRQRTVAADDFFTGMLTTARRSDELLEAVRFPLAGRGQGCGFTEFSMRHGDFAICAVAVVAHAGGLRVAVGGVTDRPVARDWPALEGESIDDALNEFAWAMDARDSPHISAATRRHLVRRLGRQAIAQARTQIELHRNAVTSRRPK